MDSGEDTLATDEALMAAVRSGETRKLGILFEASPRAARFLPPHERGYCVKPGSPPGSLPANAEIPRQLQRRRTLHGVFRYWDGWGSVPATGNAVPTTSALACSLPESFNEHAHLMLDGG
jgi:hypothetical protein